MRQTPRPRHSCDEAAQAILGVKRRCDVNVSVTDSVRGLNEKDVAGFAAEAESGFDLAGRPVERVRVRLHRRQQPPRTPFREVGIADCGVSPPSRPRRL